MNEQYKTDTKVIHIANEPDPEYGVISSPIYPAVAYAFKDTDTASSVVSGKSDGIYYGRYGNPTTKKLERKIAQMEGGEDALAVSSGMAAISISLLGVLQQGDHVLVTRDVYGGTYSFLSNLAPRFGIEYDYVDFTDTKSIEKYIQENTKAVYIETPSNPCLTILDIQEIASICNKRNLKLIVDNTFMSPILQEPLKLGADIVVHSATKYINGHGDVLAGIIVASKEDINFMRKKIMGDLGQCLNAYDAYQILRGLKTLSIRMDKHNENAQKVAEYLAMHPMVEKVYYPGLQSHKGHELAKRQMKGMGGIISFELKGDGYEAGKRFIDSLKLAMISFSLGDPETLVQHPASMTHYSIPNDELSKYGISKSLIRLSVGLENAIDIINDLKQAFQQCSNVATSNNHTS